MAQLSNIVINDGTADVTYVPYQIDSGNIARLRTNTDLAIASSELSVNARNGSTNRNVTLKITLPTVVDETVNGVVSPRVTRTRTVSVDLSLPKTTTSAERLAARVMLSNLLKNTLVASVIDNNDGLY